MHAGVQRLLQNPALIQETITRDPRLQSLLAANPQLASLLQPEKLQQVMQAVQQPESLMAGALPQVLPAGSDLSQHRKVCG